MSFIFRRDSVQRQRQIQQDLFRYHCNNYAHSSDATDKESSCNSSVHQKQCYTSADAEPVRSFPRGKKTFEANKLQRYESCGIYDVIKDKISPSSSSIPMVNFVRGIYKQPWIAQEFQNVKQTSAPLHVTKDSTHKDETFRSIYFVFGKDYDMAVNRTS